MGELERKLLDDMDNDNIKAFACYNTDVEERRKESSGGIYALLAKSVLKDKGIVYAVVYDKSFEARYERIEKESELEQSYGSKYVEARIGDIFKSIRADLSKDKRVLFVGTPCHCEGLITFLGKERGRLLCVDFICHGVPSKKVWRYYIEGITNNNPNITSINMRSKKVSWLEFGYEMIFEDKTTVFEPRMENAYLRGFLRDLYLRPSCHVCKFKGLERRTDVTIGDFWAAPKILSDEQYKDGISSIIIHTKNGLECFESIKKNLVLYNVTTEELTMKNTALVRSSRKAINRDVFFERFNDGEKIERIVNSLTGKTFISKVRLHIQKILSKSEKE